MWWGVRWRVVLCERRPFGLDQFVLKCLVCVCARASVAIALQSVLACCFSSVYFFSCEGATFHLLWFAPKSLPEQKHLSHPLFITLLQHCCMVGCSCAQIWLFWMLHGLSFNSCGGFPCLQGALPFVGNGPVANSPDVLASQFANLQLQPAVSVKRVYYLLG